MKRKNSAKVSKEKSIRSWFEKILNSNVRDEAIGALITALVIFVIGILFNKDKIVDVPTKIENNKIIATTIGDIKEKNETDLANNKKNTKIIKNTKDANYQISLPEDSLNKLIENNKSLQNQIFVPIEENIGIPNVKITIRAEGMSEINGHSDDNGVIKLLLPQEILNSKTLMVSYSKNLIYHEEKIETIDGHIRLNPPSIFKIKSSKS